ncbi:hypothetical protein BKA70DRAFT_1423500 [Coprinopsis sp. MPI-PUGE-AT-0042]|nr:hypothetical protein BKA70DRAFT_1423500 [Coprinopsis sp. MPI-PUGE-AT-0042]
MASPFQRHYPPVPLRHCYTLERVYVAPKCHLRTSYPLVEKVTAQGPTEPSPDAGVAPEGSTNGDLSAGGDEGALGAPVTANEELERILTQVPNHIREQLGLSTDTIVRLKNHLRTVIPQQLRHKQPPSKQRAKIEELHKEASLRYP